VQRAAQGPSAHARNRADSVHGETNTSSTLKRPAQDRHAAHKVKRPRLTNDSAKTTSTPQNSAPPTKNDLQGSAVYTDVMTYSPGPRSNTFNATDLFLEFDKANWVKEAWRQEVLQWNDKSGQEQISSTENLMVRSFRGLNALSSLDMQGMHLDFVRSLVELCLGDMWNQKKAMAEIRAVRRG